MSELMIPLIAGAIFAVGGAERSPDMQAAYDYAGCVGAAAIVDQASTPSIEDSMKRAFLECRSKREVALTAITATIKSRGQDAVHAHELAENILNENEASMSKELAADITTFRTTGRLPTNAQNQ